MDQRLYRLQAEIEKRKSVTTEPLSLSPAVMAVAVAAVVLLAGTVLGMRMAASEIETARAQQQDIRSRLVAAEHEIDRREAALDAQRERLDRLERLRERSATYGIPVDLAEAIETSAARHGIDATLAFEVIRVESGFRKRAVSPVGALGYAQVMPATARILSPGIARETIFDRETNLDLGFRFLRYLIERYDGDIRLALLAYNRGPATIDSVLREGENPENGYSRKVLGTREWAFLPPDEGG